jgi:hypothetical protein
MFIENGSIIYRQSPTGHQTRKHKTVIPSYQNNQEKVHETAQATNVLASELRTLAQELSSSFRRRQKRHLFCHNVNKTAIRSKGRRL